MYIFLPVIISEYFTWKVQIISSIFIYVLNVPSKLQFYNQQQGTVLEMLGET